MYLVRIGRYEEGAAGRFTQFRLTDPGPSADARGAGRFSVPSNLARWFAIAMAQWLVACHYMGTGSRVVNAVRGEIWDDSFLYITAGIESVGPNEGDADALGAGARPMRRTPATG